MSTARNVAFFALLAGAYASNPDAISFQHHLERELRKRNEDAWIDDSKLTSYVASKTVTRRNYYLFSVIKMPSEGTYLGLFGNWFQVCKRRHPEVSPQMSPPKPK